MPSLGKIRSLLDQRRAGHSLPQPFYTDPDIYEFDLAAIYGRSWIMVGFKTEVPRPGSYLALTIGRSPVVVVRDEDGALRAFFNSCRHRGAQSAPTARATRVGSSARIISGRTVSMGRYTGPGA